MRRWPRPLAFVVTVPRVDARAMKRAPFPSMARIVYSIYYFLRHQ